MGSNSKRQTTMAKFARERALQERRALKQEKKDARKQAAADARNTDMAEDTPDAEVTEDQPAEPEAVSRDA